MDDQKPRPTSTTDYAASQAPESQDAEREPERDHRAIPGGDPARATAALGMEVLDPDKNVSANFGHTSAEESGNDQAPPRRRDQ